MLTILCSPKPFVDESAWNQINALRSWRAIDPEVEIVVFGAPSGATKAVAEVDAILVPEFETSPSGAPSFNAMVSYAQKHCQHDLIVYANCDILLNKTILCTMQAARRRFDQFLLVGERLDLAQGTAVDVRLADWIGSLAGLAAKGQITAHGPTGADYFGFVRGMWAELPPVFMGRAMCDQALLHDCLRRRIPVIDGTLAVVNVHQHHGYQHVAGGRNQVFAGEDRILMGRAHGLSRSLPTVADADLGFAEDGSIVSGRQRPLRRAELALRYRYGLRNAAMALRALQYVGGKRTLQPEKIPLDTILHAWRRR